MQHNMDYISPHHRCFSKTNLPVLTGQEGVKEGWKEQHKVAKKRTRHGRKVKDAALNRKELGRFVLSQQTRHMEETQRALQLPYTLKSQCHRAPNTMDRRTDRPSAGSSRCISATRTTDTDHRHRPPAQTSDKVITPTKQCLVPWIA